MKQTTRIDFIHKKSLILGVSTVIVLGSFLLVMMRGLNFGIDFLGGVLLEIKTEQPADLNALRDTLSHLELGDINLQNIDSPYDVMIRFEKQPGGDEEQSEALKKIKKALGKNVVYSKIDSVGPTFSADLKYNAFLSFTIALLAMFAYMWLRFEWQFSLCAIIALIHDGVSIFGFYSISQFDFNETIVIAVLTTLGYSINDTVVIYDRIRENLHKFKKMPIPEVLNRSINETLSRTIFTSGTTLVALAALYVFGGAVIQNFTLPIIIGVIVGTYSSICLASALLLFFNIRMILYEGHS